RWPRSSTRAGVAPGAGPFSRAAAMAPASSPATSTAASQARAMLLMKAATASSPPCLGRRTRSTVDVEGPPLGPGELGAGEPADFAPDPPEGTAWVATARDAAPIAGAGPDGRGMGPADPGGVAATPEVGTNGAPTRVGGTAGVEATGAGAAACG